MIHLDQSHWARRFREDFIPQIRLLQRTIEFRLLPSFSGVEAEANALAQSQYELASQNPRNSYSDEAALAEWAADRALNYMMDMHDIQQGVQNLFAVALWHVVEQQLMVFHRRQVLTPSEEADLKLADLRVFARRLEDADVHLDTIAGWRAIKELECLANTVKHGEGRSHEELKELNSRFLSPPSMRERSVEFSGACRRARMPLLGDGIYVCEADLRQLFDDACEFWEELATAILVRGT